MDRNLFSTIRIKTDNPFLGCTMVHPIVPGLGAGRRRWSWIMLDTSATQDYGAIIHLKKSLHLESCEPNHKELVKLQNFRCYFSVVSLYNIIYVSYVYFDFLIAGGVSTNGGTRVKIVFKCPKCRFFA